MYRRCSCALITSRTGLMKCYAKTGYKIATKLHLIPSRFIVLCIFRTKSLSLIESHRGVAVCRMRDSIGECVRALIGRPPIGEFVRGMQTFS